MKTRKERNFNFKRNTLRKCLGVLPLLGVLLLTPSCFFQSAKQKSTSSGKDSVVNSPDTLSPGYGRVLLDNPSYLAGSTSIPFSFDIGDYVDPEQKFITSNQFLTGDCHDLNTDPTLSDWSNDYLGPSYTISSSYDCPFQVLQKKFAAPTTLNAGTWGYEPGTDEFHEVHTFYHMKKSIKSFHEGLDLAYANSFTLTDTSIPGAYHSFFGNWRASFQSGIWTPSTLTAYSSCKYMEKINAYFDPATFSLCLGVSADHTNFYFAQDPTVIYHELGHAYLSIMLNLRNTTDQLDTSVTLGQVFYDEAGAIGEGISDYFSYLINNRTYVGEWSLDNFFVPAQGRPLSENESTHQIGISTESDSRLSYPKYVNYVTHDPETIEEDVHNAGMSVSHYLTALTSDLLTYCSADFTDAQVAKLAVVSLLSETLAELGDLKARGADVSSFGNFVNLHKDVADTWIRVANPINFHSFFQTFARKLYYATIGTTDQLPLWTCSNYSVDKIETRLDEYGFLLFKTYNLNGGDENLGHTGDNLTVEELNRKYTDLISKDQLILDNRDGKTEAYLFDGRDDMVTALQALTNSGVISSPSALIDNDLPYNNNNGRISPGEVVGFMPNLLNTSNSTMAGVQLLANDWYHMTDEDSYKPCNQWKTGGDNLIYDWPLESEGAGVCGLIQNGYEADPLNNNVPKPKPVCFIQKLDTDSTLWVNQDDYRQHIALESTSCLDPEDPYSCFVRVIPGADQAYYSKLESQKLWGEIFLNEKGEPDFKISNVILMEINPWTPPGTTVNCRFRTRFTNCSDCFADPTTTDFDNYLDYEYVGPRPFEIINFQFTITD